MKPSIGFVGLGLMGSGMTRNLMKAGFDVTGYDLDPEKNGRIRHGRGQAIGRSRHHGSPTGRDHSLPAQFQRG